MSYGPILDFPLVSSYLEEDPSRSLLNDGSMDAANFAAWITADGTFSKVPGSLSGSGTRYAQIDFDGVHATAYMYQNGQFTVGAKYRFQAWGQTAAVGATLTADDGVTTFLVGTNAPAPVQFNIPFTATGTVLALRAIGLVAGRFARWDDVSITPFINRTRNAGLLGGSVQLGDGLTPATLPTRLTTGTRGFSFAAASFQTLQWLSTLASTVGTMCITFRNMNPVATAAYMFDARAGGGAGYGLINAGGTFSQSTGTSFVNGNAMPGGFTIPYGMFATIAMTGITVQSLSKIIWGSRNDGGFPWNGQMYDIKFYPYAFTATQARSYHERVMATLNLF